MTDNTTTQPNKNIIVEDLAAPQPTMTAKIIRIIGQLDESNIDMNSHIIYDLITQHPKDLFLLFDLTKLEYMNSKSIGYLTDWYTRVNEGGGKIVITNAPENIIEILTTVGITELIVCYKNIEEAQRQLFQKTA